MGKFLRLLAVLPVIFALSACAGIQGGDLNPQTGRTIVQPIFIATQRSQNSSTDSFGAERQSTVSYLRSDISIPPNHRIGQIETSGDPNDTRRNFVAVDGAVFADKTQFLRAVSQSDTPDKSNILVFIHGYNIDQVEAKFRLAQITQDFNVPMPAVLFSWPSAGEARGYIYDRDSAIYARDGLETLIRDIRRQTGRKVIIVGHSVGSFLAMEAMRQMAISGARPLSNWISGVVLMSPDIDQDVFISQLDRIGTLPKPFQIYTATQDKVLRLSAFVTGRAKRLGSLTQSRELSARGIEIVDVSAFGPRRGLNHNIATTSPAAIKSILAAIAARR